MGFTISIDVDGTVHSPPTKFSTWWMEEPTPFTSKDAHEGLGMLEKSLRLGARPRRRRLESMVKSEKVG